MPNQSQSNTKNKKPKEPPKQDDKLKDLQENQGIPDNVRVIHAEESNPNDG